eukprot:1716583-Karenia_brevis.AAC.1
MFMDNMFATESKDKKGKQEESSKVVLDENHFRRMNQFSGNVSKFRMWMVNLGVALGTADK